MSKNFSVRLDENEQSKLAEQFGSFSEACSLILEPFTKLKLVTIAELKGYFTRNEYSALLDCQNGVMLTPDFIYNKSFLLALLEDFQNLDNGISRHNAEPKSLFDKISKLSQPQVYFLIIDIYIFWINGGNDLEAMLEKMS